ncbi:MAG TPA: trigger factor [Anaerolineales bacterium]|nr:trigger factor [Anaerolineales bacterium]
MNIVKNPIADHQMELIVEVEPQNFESAKQKAAKKIASKVKVPGFRPGKAPYHVIKNMYGESAITEEAIEIVVDEIYPQAIKEAEIEPGAAGHLENIESMDPLKFKFVIPLKPEIVLGEYQTIRKTYDFVAPDDTRFNEELNNLQKMYARTETVEREVQDGDYILVDILGFDTADKDKSTELVKRDGYALVVKSEGSDNEFPFKGFSKNLIGAMPNSSIKISHKFPKTESDEKFAGKKVDFETSVKVVRAVITPPLDDEFAKMTGLGQTVDELHKNLRLNLEAESKANFDDKYYEEVLEEIKKSSTLKYPPQVVEHEIEHVLEDLEARLKQQGFGSMEEYFSMSKTNREDFVNEHARPTSIKRIERGLIMEAITEKEGIKLENAELEEEFKNYWLNLVYSDPEFAKMTKNGTKFNQDLVNAVSIDSANRLLTKKTLERLKAIANGEDIASAETVEEKPKVKKSRATKPKAEKPSEE